MEELNFLISKILHESVGSNFFSVYSMEEDVSLRRFIVHWKDVCGKLWRQELSMSLIDDFRSRYKTKYYDFNEHLATKNTNASLELSKCSRLLWEK